MFRSLSIGLVVIALLLSTALAGDKPKRIVSLYLCADELVLQLAEPQNIASVTFLSRDPSSSNVPELAAKVSVNYGHVEEIVALRPDLIIAGAYTTRAAVALLKRSDIPLIELGIPQNLDQSRHEIRTVAKAIGEVEKGERMIAAMDKRLSALSSAPPPTRLRAMVLNPNGFTVGAGSLVDEIFDRAGLENVAAERGIDNYGQLPLESIVTSAVDILILNADRDGPPSLATETLNHPALAKLAGNTRLVVLPSRLWTCGGPGIIEAIERLRPIAKAVRWNPGND
jgi:iron complex transport system substrate-binding protein